MARGGSSGRGRGGRPSGPIPRDVQLSKKLSWLLRHGAEKEGLKLASGGYVSLHEVLTNRNVAGLKPDLAEIKALVANNDKQRYSLLHISSLAEDNDAGPTALANADTDAKNYLIRANQGHSLKVDDDGLVTPLTLDSPELPKTVIHGTRHEAWPLIVKSGGLKPMRRNHVHFATGLPRQIEAARQSSAQGVDSAVEPDAASTGADVAALPDKKDAPLVLSGMRATSTILIFLDVKKALQSGIKFGISENGVVLSEGSEAGIVPMDVFERVEERGGRVLLSAGRVVADADMAKFTGRSGTR